MAQSAAPDWPADKGRNEAADRVQREADSWSPASIAADASLPHDEKLHARHGAQAPIDPSQAGTSARESALVQRGPAAQILHLPDNIVSAPAELVRQRKLWLGANALLLGLVLLQALWVFATPLAFALPGLRPALNGVCSVLACTVALPRLPDQLFIEASDLQMVNASRPNEVLLTATIRNRASLAQQLPLVELTLIAGANQTAAKKVFRPEDYMQRHANPDRGIGANQELEIRLYLHTGNILASGYRLFLFFA